MKQYEDGAKLRVQDLGYGRHEAMGLGVDQKISGVGENQNMMDEKRAALEEEWRQKEIFSRGISMFFEETQSDEDEDG